MKPGLISYQATLGIIQEQSGPLRAATIPLAKARAPLAAMGRQDNLCCPRVSCLSCPKGVRLRHG